MDTRIITGWTFLLITFAAIILGGYWFGAFISILLIFGMKELVHLMRSKDLEPSIIATYLGSFIFIILGCINGAKYFHLTTILLVIFAFLSILRRGQNARIRDIGATLICILYGGLLPSHLLLLRNIDAGTVSIYGYDFSLALGYVLMTVFAITGTDVAAYFVGCKFGKHKLWEAVSPKKTIEGSLAGAIFAVFLCILWSYYLNLTLWQAVISGLLITIFAQLGDLVESTMKRDAGAKDASDILPGHGGLLDRADSYIFTVAVIYYYLYYFVVHPIF